jgi:hypothetical protein
MDHQMEIELALCLVKKNATQQELQKDSSLANQTVGWMDHQMEIE